MTQKATAMQVRVICPLRDRCRILLRSSLLDDSDASRITSVIPNLRDRPVCATDDDLSVKLLQSLSVKELAAKISLQFAMD